MARPLVLGESAYCRLVEAESSETEDRKKVSCHGLSNQATPGEIVEIPSLACFVSLVCECDVLSVEREHDPSISPRHSALMNWNTSPAPAFYTYRPGLICWVSETVVWLVGPARDIITR